jgi:hypothetical protein
MMSEQEALSRLEASGLTRGQAKAIVETIKDRNPWAFGQAAVTAKMDEPRGMAPTPVSQTRMTELQRRSEQLILQTQKFRRQRDLIFAVIMFAGMLIIIGIVYRFF